jgi:hypothetical protein
MVSFIFHVDPPGGVVFALKEFQLERAHLDGFGHGISLGYSMPPAGNRCRKTSGAVAIPATEQSTRQIPALRALAPCPTRNLLK